MFLDYTDTEMAGSEREGQAECQSLQRRMEVMYKLHQEIVPLKSLCWRIGGMFYMHPQTCLLTVALFFCLANSF